jgi:hypothetical protein
MGGDKASDDVDSDGARTLFGCTSLGETTLGVRTSLGDSWRDGPSLGDAQAVTGARTELCTSTLGTSLSLGEDCLDATTVARHEPGNAFSLGEDCLDGTKFEARHETCLGDG